MGKLYTAMGARKHHDQADIGAVAELESIPRSSGLPTPLAAAADDEAWDKVIDADMAHAVAKAGKDVGVPLIVLDAGAGAGFFAPVLSPAPTGKAAMELWDAMVAAGCTPGFFEFKRTRTTGPVFGARPEV